MPRPIPGRRPIFAGARARVASAAACAVAVLLAATLAVPHAAHAAGPSVVAKADLSLWTGPLDTRAGFDRASRAALLVYADALAGRRAMTEAEMMAAFGIKSANRASTDAWLSRELTQSLANYRLASAGCTADDWTCIEPPATVPALATAAAAWQVKVPAAQAAWRSNVAAFTQAYVAEQMRLAALFPKITSEIDRLDDGEWIGDTLPDGRFLLTFDDGPTGSGGSTDDTLAMLAREKKSAIFFMLGGNLDARVKKSGAAAVTALYAGQCVASHGWEHQSHARWDAWQDSVKRTHALLRDTFPAPMVLAEFRPPYGQRTADSGAFFREQGLRVALWNLDSQDWNAKVTPADIVDRMVTLMLVKRHGVLLFHDVHAKALVAVPQITARLGSIVKWQECHEPVR